MFYLFSKHNWGLQDLQELWRCETGWHDLIYAMSSFEGNRDAPVGANKVLPPPVTKRRK